MGPIQKEWVASLRAHPERQTASQLGIKTPDGGYKACCLGEGALVVGTGEWRISKEDSYVELYAGDDMEYLNEETTLALGLRGSSGEFKESFEEGGSFSCLAAMNDGGWTWPEIADYIEAHPENVFERDV